MTRLKRVLFLAFGAALFVYLLWRIGPDEVADHLIQIGWGILPILAMSVAWKAVNTGAWMLAFAPGVARPGYWQLMASWLAADVANHALPAANLGGEVARSYLLRGSVPVSTSLPTVVVDKTMEVLSGLLFTIMGVGAALFVLPLAPTIRYALLGSILLGSAAILYGVRLQSRQPITRIVDLAIRMPVPTGFLEARRGSAARMDEHLAVFYAHHVGRFWVGFILHFISWVLGAFETYYIIIYMGVDFTLLNAFLLTSLTGIIKAAFFFVPAGIGAFEAGHAYLFHLLDFDPAVGLSAALVKRLRRLFWMGAGVLLFYGLSRTGGRRPQRGNQTSPDEPPASSGL